MHNEPKGGWGRSMKGAEKAVKRFNGKAETQKIGLELQEYIDECALARKLQKPSVYDLPDLKLSEIIRIFQAIPLGYILAKPPGGYAQRL